MIKQNTNTKRKQGKQNKTLRQRCNVYFRSRRDDIASFFSVCLFLQVLYHLIWVHWWRFN
ncbi:uncharacterized protein CYBJADRAFT_68583 [Cyberlindnera jadinii NRRL Y-1542]|uniref:Uncharacterized protein n=1 Tax=Cyberlindnera jadinii (strain ATCC 18201 / CBS 1600 / BCRC 20928 / JCM 3617 / NBRC 0987 / NRRL Y-1542) TaxID=983966 RepID=A0A1E4S6Q0_CYBJN|nr:hypothetical protein CYBJADRAFT_68583 [Cyberlindnera jadinii NRRL Y-1542]ODV75072.1 hypothetical protein CYBJADRAFT_68583 [Cyberlindnera jadinii NRRL Y-1542]